MSYVGTTDEPVQVGAFLPQGWKQEHQDRSALDAWRTILAYSECAARLGYDGLWVFDHLETYPDRINAPLFDPWTTLAGLTSIPDIGLGVLVNCVSHRPLSQLAKQAACVDAMGGGGRITVGLGAGWDEEEHRRHGLSFGSPRERVALLEETVTALRSLWTEEKVDFEGKYVKLAGATCSPHPSQEFALLIGGEGEKHTLRIAAEHADAVNWQVGMVGFIRKSQVLREHCERADRDFQMVQRTHAPNCLLFDSRRDFERWCRRPGADRSVEEQRVYNEERGAFIGPVEEVAEVMTQYLNAGCSGFQIYFMDCPGTEGLERFLAEVTPAAGLRVSSSVGADKTAGVA